MITLKRKKRDKKSNNKLYKTVNDLFTGRGKGKVVSRNGKRFKINHGRVLKIADDKKVLQSLNLDRQPFIEASFAGGTHVLDWQRSPQCEECTSGPNCNGLCESVKV